MNFMEAFEWFARRQEYKTAPEARRAEIVLTTGLLATPFVAAIAGFLIIDMMTTSISVDCQEGDSAVVNGVATYFDKATARHMLAGRIEILRPRKGRDDFTVSVQNFNVPWSTGKVHAALVGDCFEEGRDYLDLGNDFQQFPSQ